MSKIAVVDFRHDCYTAQQMFINSIVMIHVELHHRDDLAKIGNEFAKYARFIHSPQDELGVALRGQHFQKKPVCLGVFPQISFDQRQRTRHQLHGVGVELQAMLVRQTKQADYIDWVFPEDVVIGNGGLPQRARR